jgi:bile acid:Na+ symporter, BASS family
VQTLIDVAVPAITFVVLAVVGTDLCRADFERVLRRPSSLIAGLFAPVLILPVLAVGLLVLFDPPPATATGLLLVAACPIGGISNTYSYLARASSALSVTLTVLSCLFAVATIPLVSGALAWGMGRPLGIEAPVPLLVAQLVLMLMAPVVLGMATRQRWPHQARRYRPWLQGASFLALGLLLTMVILDDLPRFLDGLPTTVPLAATFVLCSMLAGWTVGRVIAAEYRDCFTLAAEFATRNVAVAIVLAVTLLHQLAFAAFATTYFLTEVLLLVPAAAAFRRLMPESREANLPFSPDVLDSGQYVTEDADAKQRRIPTS